MGKMKFGARSIEFDIGPYGRQEINGGADCFGLVECTVPAMQLEAHGKGTRLDIGAAMPLRGSRRYLRNPFGFPARGRLVDCSEMHFAQPLSGFEAQFLRTTRAFMGWVSDAVPPVDHWLGVMFMSRRSEWSIDLTLGPDHLVQIIPGGTIERLEHLPPGYLAASSLVATTMDGVDQTDLTIRAGQIGTGDHQAWAEAAGFAPTVKIVANGATHVRAHITPGCALRVRGPANDPGIFCNAEFTDMGAWSLGDLS